MSLLLYCACIDCDWQGHLDMKDAHERDNPSHIVVIREEEVPCGCS